MHRRQVVDEAAFRLSRVVGPTMRDEWHYDNQCAPRQRQFAIRCLKARHILYNVKRKQAVLVRISFLADGQLRLSVGNSVKKPQRQWS